MGYIVGVDAHIDPRPLGFRNLRKHGTDLQFLGRCGHRPLRWGAMFLFVCFLLLGAVGATDLEAGLSPEVQGQLGNISPTYTGNFTQDLWKLANGAFHNATDVLTGAIGIAVSMLAVILLCAMVTQMESKLSGQAVTLLGVLALSLLSISNVQTMVGLGRDTLADLQVFTGLLLPVLASSMAASGGVATAGVLYAGSVFVSNILMTLMNHLLVPLIYAYLAISAGHALLDNQSLKQIQKFVKWVITWGLKGVVYGFCGYLTLSGIISGAGDATAIKIAKATMSTVVPVIGSAISGASETVLLTATMVKNGAGIFGMLAVIAICITPLLRLGIQYLVLKITTAVGGTMGEKSLVEFLEHITETVGFLVAIMAACGFMMLVACASALKVL